MERLSAHAGAEDIAELALALAVVVLVEERHDRQRFQLVAVGLSLLAQTDHLLVHALAQPFTSHIHLAAQFIDLAPQVLQSALLVFLGQALDGL